MKKSGRGAPAGRPSGPRASPRTAILVTECAAGLSLSPFFVKCDGVLVLDGRRPAQVHRNEGKTSEAVCDLIVRSGANQLVCGFVGNSEKEKLRAAGIEVRLGSCACALQELAACFCDLPEA